MTKTLLNGVNEILKRCGVISGDAGSFATLVDSARQRPIDVSVQVINEGISELYYATRLPMPSEQAESNFSLVAATRAYTLATDMVRLRWPLIDRTNSQFILEFPGGFNQMLVYDIEQDDTGLPHYAAIRETDGKLYLDAAPTSAEAGRVYYYQYDKDLVLDEAADAMPFSDAVFRSMVPAWVQLYKREMRNEFDQPLFDKNIGIASSLLTRKTPRASYLPHRC